MENFLKIVKWAGLFNRDLRVVMKNVVECYKDFFDYFNALETKGDLESDWIKKKNVVLITTPSEIIWPLVWNIYFLLYRGPSIYQNK